jgi:hypothetical protein
MIQRRGPAGLTMTLTMLGISADSRREIHAQGFPPRNRRELERAASEL